MKYQSQGGDEPAIWFPTIRAGTGADVFVERLISSLREAGIRAEASWLPHRAEYLPWLTSAPEPPEWANVVHVNSWLPHRFIPDHLPLVVTVHHLVHDPLFSPFRSFAQAAYHEAIIRPREFRLLRSAHAVSTVSEYVRETVQRFSNREGIHVIPNWVEPKRDGQIAAHATEDGVFRILLVGSRTRRKGFHLLPAFVNALGSGFEVRAVGQGHEGAMKKIPSVVDLGRLSESALLREYRTCDAVVSLSSYEGFGYTAIEAMANEKPFIGFRTSALSEVVSPEVGILVDLGNVEALAATARGLAMDRERCRSIGLAGRNRVVWKYGPGNVSKYVDLYRSLIRSQSGRH